MRSSLLPSAQPPGGRPVPSHRVLSPSTARWPCWARPPTVALLVYQSINQMANIDMPERRIIPRAVYVEGVGVGAALRRGPLIGPYDRCQDASCSASVKPPTSEDMTSRS
jgi:hypothetical protein